MTSEPYIIVSKIENGELKEIAGFMWETPAETRQAFRAQKKADIGYGEGRYCVDYYPSFGTLGDTATVERMPE